MAARSPPAIPSPQALTKLLDGWFSAAKRDLPWRSDRTPYRVWLSEVMLQQTQVAVVADYFERFTARFPRVEDLARASEDEVLSLWSGLGYYARGRNLHRTAAVVADERGGLFPSTAPELQTLPGVGPYTAGAIASLAFGARAAIVDGNVSRVFARLFDDAVPIDSTEGKKLAWERAKIFVEAAPDPALFNEGLMELGALVCTPRSPKCDACPWAKACRGRASGRAPDLPTKLPKKARKHLRVVVAVAHTPDGHVWLEKRNTVGLFKGLYTPPCETVEGRVSARKIAIALLEARGIAAPTRLPKAIQVERTLTHREIRFAVFSVGVYDDATSSNWKRKHDLKTLGISAATKAILDVGWPKAVR